MTSKSTDPLTRIAAARNWALGSLNADVLFYATAGLFLRDVIDPSVPTACTDGRVIKWNPEFLAQQSDEQVRFILLHEILHCLHGHFWRLPITDEGNVAGDYAINRVLRVVAGIKAPAGILDDRRFDALAEEEILKALRQQPQQTQQPQPQPQGGAGAEQQPQDGSGDGDKGDGTPQPAKPAKSPAAPLSDKGGCGGFEKPAPDAQPAGGDDGDDGDKPQPAVAKPTTLRDEWDRVTVQAAQAVQSLQQGRSPAGADRLLARIRITGKPDWRAETSEFIRSMTPTRTDWSRQSRRMATADVIYPRRRRDEVGTVVFVRDTSGSVSTDLVAKFNAHIADLMDSTGCDAVILDADAAVQAEHRLSAGEAVPDRASGGGGTDFRPAFNRVRELADDGERIAGVVYLTDLMGVFPPADDVDAAVLWVATTDLPAPFGRTVRIEA